MFESLYLAVGFLAALIAAAVLCRGVMMLGVVDAPTEARKTQAIPVPTLGGLGVAAGAVIGIAATLLIGGWSIGPWSLANTTLVAFGGALAALAIGLADDTMKIPPLGRLLATIVIAFTLTVLGVRVDVLALWPGVALDLLVIGGVIGSVLWLVVVTNAVNFMDGANGLSMGMAAIAAAGLAAAAAITGAWNIALLSAVLSGGLCGFLVWNLSGKLFVGDAGAYFAGMLLGALSLNLVALRPDLLFVPPILLMPLLSDVILTVLWRLKHGKKFWVAHRDHAYQIALKAGLKHWQVSLIHAVWALNAAVIGLVAAIVGREVPPIAFLILLGVSTWLHLWVRKVGVRAGLVGASVA
jgi:UDP-N-acetylmuramyl pentapeptide phosphotransferase/UDP-N-acetylglucosamine-1-phosphate transferase